MNVENRASQQVSGDIRLKSPRSGTFATRLPRESPVLEKMRMTSGYFRIVHTAFGGSPLRFADILAGTGLNAEDMRTCIEEISVSQQIQQFRNMCRLHGDDWAVSVPHLWGPSSHGFLGVASMASENLATMMHLISRYGPVRAPYHKAVWRRGPVCGRLEFALIAPIEPRFWQMMTEITFIGLNLAIKQLLSGSFHDLSFNFTGDEPEHAPKLKSLLGDKITYNATTDAIVVPSALLDIASPFADPLLYRVANAELRAFSRRLEQPANMCARVEQILRSLPASRLTENEVAQTAGVSRRTLVRRLAESGVSYRQLVGEEMRRRAEKLLSEGIDRAQAAEELGYMDPTSFSRACRRWFGHQRRTSTLAVPALVGSDRAPQSA